MAENDEKSVVVFMNACGGLRHTEELGIVLARRLAYEMKSWAKPRVMELEYAKLIIGIEEVVFFPAK